MVHEDEIFLVIWSYLVTLDTETLTCIHDDLGRVLLSIAWGNTGACSEAVRKADYGSAICNIKKGNNLKVYCLQWENVYTGIVTPWCAREDRRCISESQVERSIMKIINTTVAALYMAHWFSKLLNK